MNSTSDNIAPVIPPSILKKKQEEIQEASDLNEISRLRAANMLYEEYRPLWDFYLSAYEGGPDFTNAENINRHPREHVDDFDERVKRLHYLNYCEPLVDFFTAFIFAETIQRNGGSEPAFYQEFIKDVNKKGEDITSFMQQLSDAKQIFGMVYVLVDAPQVPERTLTKAEENKLGIRPYWVMITPQEVLDWIVDPFDKYVYFKRVQHLERIQDGYKQYIEKYYEWSPDEIKITVVDVTNPNKPILMPPVILPNSLGEVPIVLLRYKRSIRHKYMGNSFLRDIALNNKEVMNLTSLLQEFLYRQCFNILAMQMDGALPTNQQNEGDVGTANILQYPEGAQPPSYIVPSAEPAKFLQDERQRIVQEMYKRAAQDTVNELFNGGKASGFSKSQSFSTSVPKIATRAEILEKAENKLMQLTMQYMGKVWDGKILYKDRYELTNISDALSQLNQLFNNLQMPSETFIKEEFKRFVHEFDGKLSDESMTKIYAEIEDFDYADWQDTMKLALIGRAATSPEIGTAFGKSATSDTNASKQQPTNAAPKPTRKPSTQSELSKESSKGK